MTRIPFGKYAEGFFVCGAKSYANVDCVPFNILDPRPGTPLQDMKHITPLELLVTIATFRFMLPDKDIKLCGGKK